MKENRGVKKRKEEKMEGMVRQQTATEGNKTKEKGGEQMRRKKGQEGNNEKKLKERKG